MPDKDAGPGELHEATRGGEHIVIRPAKPKDKALYLDFLRDVSAEDLRLRGKPAAPRRVGVAVIKQLAAARDRRARPHRPRWRAPASGCRRR